MAALRPMLTAIAASATLMAIHSAARAENCRFAEALNGETYCYCERGGEWENAPNSACPSDQPYRARIDHGWVCFHEFASRDRAVAKAQAHATGRGERFRTTEMRVFQRKNGRYLVCTGQMKVKKFHYYAKRGWRSGPSRTLYSGEDFTARIWASAHAEDVDSGRQEARIKRQLGAVVEGIEKTAEYCANNPGACGSTADPDQRDPTRDIMDNVFCQYRGIC